MSHLQYFSYEGFGTRSLREINYSQTARHGPYISISGQGGWDRATEEIPTDRDLEVDAAFDNVEFALQHAGGTGFDQVFRLRVYTTNYNDELAGRLVENIKRRFPKHPPLLTLIGVSALYGKMTIEIEAEAMINDA